MTVLKDTFQNSENLYRWLEKYNQSLQNLRKLDQASPGVTPTQEVFRVDNVRLLKFENKLKPRFKKPILISYALVNRFTIADLQEDKSLVQKLLDEGIEIYVMDWGYPTIADRYNDLDDYINHYIDSCVDALLSRHEVDSLNLLGICQGGTLSVCYSAINPHKINRLISMVTPVDFQTKDDVLSHMVNKIDLQGYVDAYGNISGQYLNLNFNMLQPIALNLQKWIKSVDSLSDEKVAQFYLNMESWINDSPDQAGAAYQEFIESFYQKNKLIKGELMIGDKTIDTHKIDMPVLNIYGSYDHLVPPAASKALKKLIGSKDYQELEVKTGHIGMYVSSKARAVPEAIAKWLRD